MATEPQVPMARGAGRPSNRRLIVVALTVLPAMVLGLENALGKPSSAVLLLAYGLLPLLISGRSSVGLTRARLRESILAGAAVGLAYGTIRGLALRFIGGAEAVFGADLIRIVTGAGAGIHVGRWLLTGLWWVPLLAVALSPAFLLLELYFRGFLFLNLRKYVHWAGAIAIASAVQSIARRTPHSLLMGSIGGLLMQRFENIAAPAAMHGVQFITALTILVVQ